MGASRRWRGSDCIPSDRKCRIASALGCREQRGSVETSSSLVNAVRALCPYSILGCSGMAKPEMGIFDKDEPTKYRAHVTRDVNHQNRSGDD
jgi:hypothetical protein